MGLFVALFAQPKLFDPDFYQDSTTTYNPKFKFNPTKSQMSKAEKKYLDNYRTKYMDLGLKPGDDNIYMYKEGRYLYEKSDLFYHNYVDIDNIDEYTKMGLDVRMLDTDIYDNQKSKDIIKILENQIVLVGTIIKLEELNVTGEEYYTICVNFKVDKVIKGSYYYDKFPVEVKCYIHDWLTTNSRWEPRKTDPKFKDAKYFRSSFLYDPRGANGLAEVGTKYLLYLSKNVGNLNEQHIQHYDGSNVFFRVIGYEQDQSLNYQQKHWQELEFLGKRIDALNKNEFQKRGLIE